MKYREASSFRQALEQRLLDRARQSGLSVARLRKQIVFDRLLARLVRVAPDRWVLKGAFALDLRLGDRARMTKDIDLARSDDEESATADLIAAAATDLGDFFVLSVERSRQLLVEGEWAAVRYRARGELAGRLFEEVIVDVGFTSDLPRHPDRLQTPGHLAFAGIPPVEVPAIPLEQHVAEKAHAYSRRYASGASTRVKDLVDMALIASYTSLDARRLREALVRTFKDRASHDLPERLPDPPADWGPPYRRLAGGVGLPADLASGHAEAAALLDPVLGGLDRGSWDPIDRTWRE